MNESGTTKLMERIHCKDEARELQEILMNNTDLLPGDQIDPEDPSRWMLIKREMPVASCLPTYPVVIAGISIPKDRDRFLCFGASR